MSTYKAAHLIADDFANVNRKGELLSVLRLYREEVIREVTKALHLQIDLISIENTNTDHEDDKIIQTKRKYEL